MSKQSRNRKPGNPRACVFEALRDWEDTSYFAADILNRVVEDRGLESKDQGLARDLMFGTLRQLGFLDRVIDQLRSRGKLKPTVHILLRLGLYQIFLTKIADHAAVNETVALARKHEKGLVNAVLRNAIRQRDDILARSKEWPLEDRLSHPSFLIERWTRDHGETNALALCEWNNEAPPVFARIHDPEGYEEHLARMSPELARPEPVEGFPEFIRLPPGPPPREWIEDGLIYIQDPSTSLACHLLDPQEDEMILDACAAPGGKTGLLSRLLDGSGKLYASDSNPHRLALLRENLDRLKVASVEIREIDWTKPGSGQLRDLPEFDAILLDVPCSNTGVMRRRVDVRWRLREEDFDQLNALQIKILKHAVSKLKPGGRIVYSTCSIDFSENRELVESCGLEVEEIRESLPWKDGVDGAFAALLRPH